jgi:hypothetical protein
MRWIAIVMICLCAMMVCACGLEDGQRSYGSETDGSIGTEDPNDPGDIEPPPIQLHCDGICVETAPAPYTGPSLFWIHPPNPDAGCPEKTPHQGIEGFVQDPMPLYARECKVTPSELCGDEGLTCVPLPDDAFQICIHHADDKPCKGPYPLKSIMFELESMMMVTVCCQPPPPPG